MEQIKSFLESSTIHGLMYISSAKKYVRLFWVIVVISGFTMAGALIHRSFDDWSRNPVKTTIETQPITDITLPKVTVCPPKFTYTDLNYDLMKIENMTLDDANRTDLLNYAMRLMWDDLHVQVMANLSRLQDTDRYYNWYHGYTEINVMLNWYYSYCYHCPKLRYATMDCSLICPKYTYAAVETYAASGTIFSQYFGDKFDVDKVETDMSFTVQLHPPNIKNLTLHINFEKISLTYLSGGYDELGIDKAYVKVKTSGLLSNGFDGWLIDEILNERQVLKNFTPPGKPKLINFIRKVIKEDIKRENLEYMPGFRMSWYYSGMDFLPEPKYSEEKLTRLFVR